MPDQEIFKDETIKKIIEENKLMKEKITALLEIIDEDELSRLDKINDVKANRERN